MPDLSIGQLGNVNHALDSVAQINKDAELAELGNGALHVLPRCEPGEISALGAKRFPVAELTARPERRIAVVAPIHLKMPGSSCSARPRISGRHRVRMKG